MGKIINSVSPFDRKFILIPSLLEKKNCRTSGRLFTLVLKIHISSHYWKSIYLASSAIQNSPWSLLEAPNLRTLFQPCLIGTISSDDQVCTASPSLAEPPHQPPHKVPKMTTTSGFWSTTRQMFKPLPVFTTVCLSVCSTAPWAPRPRPQLICVSSLIASVSEYFQVNMYLAEGTIDCPTCEDSEDT